MDRDHDRGCGIFGLIPLALMIVGAWYIYTHVIHHKSPPQNTAAGVSVAECNKAATWIREITSEGAVSATKMADLTSNPNLIPTAQVVLAFQKEEATRIAAVPVPTMATGLHITEDQVMTMTLQLVGDYATYGSSNIPGMQGVNLEKAYNGELSSLSSKCS